MTKQIVLVFPLINIVLTMRFCEGVSGSQDKPCESVNKLRSVSSSQWLDVLFLS